MVALMCELLRLRGDETVLDVGTGSGYAAAVLARLAQWVVSIERVPELAAQAEDALAAAGVGNVIVVVGDGSTGGPGHAPYDAIAVAAASPVVPDGLIGRLAPGGRLVIPVGSRQDQSLALVERQRDKIAVRRTVACRFVPLLGAGAFEGGD